MWFLKIINFSFTCTAINCAIVYLVKNIVCAHIGERRPVIIVVPGDLHDISANHRPGDPEKPWTVTSSLGDTNANHKVLIDNDNRGHSGRQSPSPLTTSPTQQGSPPDEDVMPKRVADGRRYQHHMSTDNVTQSKQNQQDET